MSDTVGWTARAPEVVGNAALIHYVCTRSTRLEAENGELRRQIEFWRDYTGELERELARASAQAWDTVAEVPIRAVWESIVDARLAGEPGRTAVVWADLDHFKQVNDRHGHLVGDAVLREVARRLQDAFAARSPVVTRLGGDEFGVVVSDLDENTDLARFATLMLEPVPLPAGRSVHVSASVGYAHAAELPCGAGRDELLRRADAGVYAHKPDTAAEVRCTPGPRGRARASADAVLGAAR